MFVLVLAVNDVLIVYHIIIIKQELISDKTYVCSLLDERFVNDRHQCHMNAKFGVFVDEDHGKLRTIYWLPKIPYKSRFIANSSSCPTTELLFF